MSEDFANEFARMIGVEGDKDLAEAPEPVPTAPEEAVESEVDTLLRAFDSALSAKRENHRGLVERIHPPGDAA